MGNDFYTTTGVGVGAFLPMITDCLFYGFFIFFNGLADKIKNFSVNRASFIFGHFF